MRAALARRSPGATGNLRSVRVALALAPMLAVMATGVSAAAAALPAPGNYTSRAAGQRSPYVLIEVGGRHRIGLISLAHLRCMSGRLDMMLGIRQKGGSFSITRRSGTFHAKTGRMLLGRDERVRGRFTSPGTATGSARVINIPRLGGRPCDSGWVRFRVAVMNPVEILPTSPGVTMPGVTILTLPGMATEQIKIVNRSIAPSEANRIALTLQARPSEGLALGSVPAPTVTTPQGHCSTRRWQMTSNGLESTIACDLGRLKASQRTVLTVRSSFPSVSCTYGGFIRLSIGATIERATLNDMVPDGLASEFQLECHL